MLQKLAIKENSEKCGFKPPLSFPLNLDREHFYTYYAEVYIRIHAYNMIALLYYNVQVLRKKLTFQFVKYKKTFFFVSL